jgi:hypothetical protein
MVGDNIVMHSVSFKPLFGSKAENALQGIIKVIKNPNIVMSDSEIKSQVVMAINEYFDIENWDFGDTFHFSELSAYVHKRLGSFIGSITVIPKVINGKFGDLYEIKSAPYEIFVNGAQATDIVVITALTPSELIAG